jgi:crossover junction endodeoxyribonuclease RuvC
MQNGERIILGVDPGTTIMGFGVIGVTGKKMRLITLDVINLKKLDNHFLKLQAIFEKSLRIIEEFLPDEMALEAPFFGKNVQSMLKLGRAQGVVMAAGLYRQIPVVEYSPRKIKQSITGKGSASKEQVSAMLQQLFQFEEVPKYLDATDGLAVAVCHAFQNQPAQLQGSSKKINSWESFISNNPSRLR